MTAREEINWDYLWQIDNYKNHTQCLSKLLLTIITILLSVSEPTPALTTCWAGADQWAQARRKVLQLVSTQYRVGCLFQVTTWKVALTSDCSERWFLGCLWCRSRIRAHNELSEAEKLLDLSQDIFLLTTSMHQSSSSNLHRNLNSKKIRPVGHEFGQAKFLVIAYMTGWLGDRTGPRPLPVQEAGTYPCQSRDLESRTQANLKTSEKTTPCLIPTYHPSIPGYPRIAWPLTYPGISRCK